MIAPRLFGVVALAAMGLLGTWLNGGYRKGEVITGIVQWVDDGDGFKLGGESLRVWGIDAPEYDQICEDRKGQQYACGQVALHVLRSLVQKKSVHCVVKDVDRHHRPDVMCTLPDGRDLGRALVEAGAAVDLPQYSHGFYAKAEAGAKAGGVGIWQGRFDRPEVWKQAKRRQA